MTAVVLAVIATACTLGVGFGLGVAFMRVRYVELGRVADLALERAVREREAGIKAGQRGQAAVERAQETLKAHQAAFSRLLNGLSECAEVCEGYADEQGEADRGGEPLEDVKSQPWFSDVESAVACGAATDCANLVRQRISLIMDDIEEILD